MPRQPEGVRLSIAEALEVGGVIFGPVLAPSPRIAGFRTRWTRRVCCDGGFAGRRVVQREECNQPSASHAAASILDKGSGDQAVRSWGSVQARSYESHARR